VRLDLLFHGAPDAPLQTPTELCALVDPDGAETGCNRALPAPKKSICENEHTCCEERAKLDVVGFLFGRGH
jgi:hypothetical protein